MTPIKVRVPTTVGIAVVTAVLLQQIPDGPRFSNGRRCGGTLSRR